MSATLLDVTAVRARFTALQRRLAFFDGPGGTQCPDEVIDAISHYLRHDNANVGAPYETSRRTSELVDLAHETAGRFLGCSGDEVAFGQSMTALNFLLTRALGRELRPGDEVLVTKLDHDANVAPWLHLQQDLGIVVRHIDVHEDLSLDLDSLESQLGERTRVVAFPVAANSVGTAPDVKRIAALAHGAGALAWADAVHFGPHGQIDVSDWDVDVLVCSPVQVLRAAPGDGLRQEGAARLVAAVQGTAGRRRSRGPSLRARHLPARAARRLRGCGALSRVTRLGGNRRPRASAGRAVTGGPARRRRAVRAADDGGPGADVLLQRAGADLGGGRRPSRRDARGGSVVGQLLRRRDDEAARARPLAGGGAGRDRALQHGRRGRTGSSPAWRSSCEAARPGRHAVRRKGGGGSGARRGP